MTDLQADATDLLQRLIRFNTVNPPGNERPVMELLEALLTDAGFECELVGEFPERPNLIARLRGDDPEGGPTLGLLSHVDTVLANPADWSRDPWSGDVADGFLWGRGALDMKNQTACEVAAAASLARDGWRPAHGELVVFVVVDEETGGEHGAQYLTTQHPDKSRCDLLVNEGGGAVFETDGRRFYGVCVGEKGVFRFTVTTDGAAGHASIPRMGDNALLKLAPILERFAAKQPSLSLTDAPRALFAALDGVEPDALDADAALERLRTADPKLALVLEPTLGVTLTPTKAHASDKINVIPAQATIGVDCRVPPGLGEDAARASITEVLGDDGFRIDFTEKVVGNRSEIDTPFMTQIREWVKRNDPGAEVVPTVLPGFTDSRSWRDAFPECVAYGFFPQRHQSLLEGAPLIHGADERIDVRDLGFAATYFRDLITETLG